MASGAAGTFSDPTTLCPRTSADHSSFCRENNLTLFSCFFPPTEAGFFSPLPRCVCYGLSDNFCRPARMVACVTHLGFVLTSSERGWILVSLFLLCFPRRFFCIGMSSLNVTFIVNGERTEKKYARGDGHTFAFITHTADKFASAIGLDVDVGNFNGFLAQCRAHFVDGQFPDVHTFYVWDANLPRNGLRPFVPAAEQAMKDYPDTITLLSVVDACQGYLLFPMDDPILPVFLTYTLLSQPARRKAIQSIQEGHDGELLSVLLVSKLLSKFVGYGSDDDTWQLQTCPRRPHVRSSTGTCDVCRQSQANLINKLLEE